MVRVLEPIPSLKMGGTGKGPTMPGGRGWGWLGPIEPMTSSSHQGVFIGGSRGARLTHPLTGWDEPHHPVERDSWWCLFGREKWHLPQESTHWV